jgi:hypothetical protein
MRSLEKPYGSEWHLLRYLGRHRDRLNERVAAVVGGAQIRWKDFRWRAGGGDYFNGPIRDAEWKQLDFLPEATAARQAWAAFWPQGGNVQNWDAVGAANVNGQDEWLLVEAKSHTAELSTQCGAAAHGGLQQITDAMTAAKAAFNVEPEYNWLTPYFQFCNRLAVLYFLTAVHNIAARLVFVYFCGDTFPSRNCPVNEQAWQPTLANLQTTVGLTGQSNLEQPVHKLFLPVHE